MVWVVRQRGTSCGDKVRIAPHLARLSPCHIRLRAKSRLRRLRSETRLRAQPQGKALRKAQTRKEGFPPSGCGIKYVRQKINSHLSFKTLAWYHISPRAIAKGIAYIAIMFIIETAIYDEATSFNKNT